MGNFETVWPRIKGIEGGFSDNVADRGHATKFGITEAVARANFYTGRMEDLPEARAQEIAKSQYWDIMRLDEVSQLSFSVASELFDTGYNMGVGTAGKFLQRSLNALNRQQQDYPDVTADGVVGPLTVHALRLYLVKRSLEGEDVLVKALNCLQGSRYIEIAEADKTQEANVYGWLRVRT